VNNLNAPRPVLEVSLHNGIDVWPSQFISPHQFVEWSAEKKSRDDLVAHGL
jgi:hypothetical protein